MGSQSATMQKLSDGTLQWRVGEFVITLRSLAPGVVYAATTGSGEHVFVPEFAAALAAEIATHGRLVGFVNLREANRFGGEARDGWSEWTKKYKQQASAHFLVRSKLVDMALSLIAMFSGADLRVYSDVERFSAAMQLAAPNAVLPKLRNVA